MMNFLPLVLANFFERIELHALPSDSASSINIFFYQFLKRAFTDMLQVSSVSLLFPPLPKVITIINNTIPRYAIFLECNSDSLFHDEKPFFQFCFWIIMSDNKYLTKISDITLLSLDCHSILSEICLADSVKVRKGTYCLPGQILRTTAQQVRYAQESRLPTFSLLPWWQQVYPFNDIVLAEPFIRTVASLGVMTSCGVVLIRCHLASVVRV